MPPFVVDVATQADTAASKTLAVAFVDIKGLIISANSAFFQTIQCSHQLNKSLTDLLCARFPDQQQQIIQGFVNHEASWMQLCLPGTEAVSMTISAVDSRQRLVQVANASETTDDPHGHIYKDPLTGLGNRRLLDHVIAQRSSNEKHLSMLIMDLDHFKQINDTLGHVVGDKLLKFVAERTKRVTRENDVVVRIGGDEFIILHESGESTLNSATHIAGRLVDMMNRPFLIEGHQLNIGASVGISVLNNGTDRVEDMFRHADLALYSAKDAGRNNYQHFMKELEEKALARRELEIQLRRALSLNEFELMYQPQVDMPEGKLTGFEALIRWNSSHFGLMIPQDFIPLAEETGEIIAIGDWVLETACLQATHWDDQLTVAVNVSPVQFTTDQFVNSVKRALQKSGLPPRRLEIEITETVLTHKPEQALTHLQAIREMGISIAMDDFGTGYSSLSYLNDFPFSKIKIDRAFVSQQQSRKSKALVNAIISLGTSLGLKTIAEGVETREQFDLLSQSGCIAAQGFLISQPLPAEEIEDFIRSGGIPDKDKGSSP